MGTRNWPRSLEQPALPVLFRRRALAGLDVLCSLVASLAQVAWDAQRLPTGASGTYLRQAWRDEGVPNLKGLTHPTVKGSQPSRCVPGQRQARLVAGPGIVLEAGPL